MSGSRGSSGQRTVRRGSAIASASSRMRSAQGEAAEVQRIAPIFGQTRRAIQEGQAPAIVEMMAGQQATTGSSQTTTVTSTPVSSRRPPLLEVTSTPAASSDPALDVSLLMISPASASTLRTVVAEIEGMVGPVDQAAFGEEPEAGDVGREEVVGGSQEDLFGHEDTDLDYDDDDDPGSDLPYVPIFSPEGSEEEEEEVVFVQPRSSMTGRRGSQEEPQPAASAATTTPTIPTTTTTSTTSEPQTSGTQQQQAPPSSRKGHFTSPIWDHFSVSTLDETFAVCKHCKETKSRGKNPARLGTSCLQAHLKRDHRPLYDQFIKVRDAGRGHPSAAASRPEAATAGALPRPAPSSAVSRALPVPTTELQSSQSSVASSAPSTAPSSAYQAAGKRQSLLSEAFPGVTKALPPGHRRIRQLNGLLARAMCSQLLPYSLVQPGSDMRALLQCAAPEWPIPSRHFFSCTAIPALHQSVVSNVGRSLDHAVGERVHITMDSWTSRFGTDRYLSFTAHWVSLVEVGEGSAATGTAAAQWVVPPRGVRGDAAGSSDPLLSSGTSAKRTRLHTSSVKPRLCQALLEMRAMGAEKMTASAVLKALRDQESRWLSNRGLRVGLVVSDNGANLIAAISRGNLDHIPCLAHVLNLVVQRFLRTYQGMGDLLEVARSTVRHFRRSPASSALLADLQQEEGLPRHRMLLDVPTRWNSTLAMLERLLKHRRAVSRYIGDLLCSGSTALQVITNAQWGMMQQVALVLAPFLQGTEEVSREQTSLCEWVPLVCLLDRALFDLLEQGEAALEQLEQQQALSTSEGEEEEEEEEEVDVPDLAGDEGEERSAAALERGWNRREDVQRAEEEDRRVVCVPLDADVAAVANLFPMAAHMLRCLRRDPRVIQMRKREDIWITLMLDPRLKGKLGQFMQGGDKEQQTRRLQQALVRKLEEAFPHPCTPPAPVQPTQQTVPAPSSSSRRPADLQSLKRQLYRVELPTEEVRGAAAPSSTSQHQRFTRMVADYMGSFSGLDTEDPVDPMEYWVKMLGIWRELAQYALELLSSPPSSVLSERSFSAAGGVVTEKRSRLSTKSVDRLTFLKMNQAWVEGEFLAPAVGERRRRK